MSLIVAESSAGTVDLTLTVGQNINAFQVVALHDDGLAYIASADDLADVGRVVGVAVSSALTGSNITVRQMGEVDNNGFLFTPGHRQFLQLGGAIGNSLRVGLFEQPLGVAASSSRLLLELGRTVIYA